MEKRISAAAGMVRREIVEEARLRIVVIMVNWWKWKWKNPIESVIRRFEGLGFCERDK